MRAALSLNLLFSVSVPPGFYDRWIYRKIKQTPLFSQIFQIAADFARRRVLWRHRNAHSVKERLFLSSKKEINSFAFSLHPIYKSYIGQTNRNKSALLVWAILVYLLGPELRAALDHVTPLYTVLGDYSEVVKFTAESITSQSDLVRSIQFGTELC